MHIIWTEPSLVDLDNIFEYISHDSEFYAQRFIDKIIKSVDKLNDFPNLGRVVPEVNIVSVREIIYYSYRIIYQVTDNEIIILAVINSNRLLDNKIIQKWEIL